MDLTSPATDCKTGLDFSGSRSGLRVYLEKVSSSYFPSVYFTFQVEAFASVVSAGLCIAGVVTNNNNRRSCDFAPAPEQEATLSPESCRRHTVTHTLIIPLLGFPSFCRKGAFFPFYTWCCTWPQPCWSHSREVCRECNCTETPRSEGLAPEGR